MGTNWQTVESSNVDAVAYDEPSGVLKVKFKGGGTYEYSGVPQGEFDSLMSGSVGSHLRNNIMGTYPHKKVG